MNGYNEGVFGGIISAIDRWLVKIKCQTLKGDGVKNQGSFYCHKGFYAVNIQAMVNQNKIITWRSIKCWGSEHNLTEFKRLKLYDKLVNKTNLLK